MKFHSAEKQSAYTKHFSTVLLWTKMLKLIHPSEKLISCVWACLLKLVLILLRLVQTCVAVK